MSKIPDTIRKELATLAGRSDDEIDFSDIPATTEHDWNGAVRGKFYKPIKLLRVAEEQWNPWLSEPH